RGTLYTYSIVYRAFDAWFKERTPYGIVVIELEEGNRILGNYFGEDVETLACGLPMEGYFEKVDESTTLLQWKKALYLKKNWRRNVNLALFAALLPCFF